MAKVVEEKVLTLHPLGKSGRNISKEKYDTIKQAILKALQKSELNHTQLTDAVIERLKNSFPDNIGWYTETVKLDLEARDTIERTSDKPQKYRLKS